MMPVVPAFPLAAMAVNLRHAVILLVATRFCQGLQAHEIGASPPLFRKALPDSQSAHVLCKVYACLCKHFRKRDAPYAEPSANIGDLDRVARRGRSFLRDNHMLLQAMLPLMQGMQDQIGISGSPAPFGYIREELKCTFRIVCQYPSFHFPQMAWIGQWLDPCLLGKARNPLGQFVIANRYFVANLLDYNHLPDVNLPGQPQPEWLPGAETVVEIPCVNYRTGVNQVDHRRLASQQARSAPFQRLSGPTGRSSQLHRYTMSRA